MKKLKKIIFTLFLIIISTQKVYAKTMVFTADIANFCNEQSALNVLKMLGYLLLAAKILIPILLIIFGTIDFAKAVIASKPDEINKSARALVTRVIAGVVIFLIPTIVNFTFNLFPNNTSAMKFSKCRICIFKPGDCGNNITSHM